MKNYFLFTLLFSSICLHAQDVILKKNYSIINCQVVEIGIESIRYKPDSTSKVIFNIHLDDVAKVTFANGREIYFTDPLKDPSRYEGDFKSAFKVHFLSPIFENLAVSYEKVLIPGRNVEFDVGIIGLGFDTNPDVATRGAFVSVGLKLLNEPNFRSKRVKYTHILKGSYVKPQFSLSVYDFERGSIKDQITAGALFIVVGNQHVYDNDFLIDYSLGVGYGYSSTFNKNRDITEERVNHYAFVMGERDSPFAITLKLKIGFPLK